MRTEQHDPLLPDLFTAAGTHSTLHVQVLTQHCIRCIPKHRSSHGRPERVSMEPPHPLLSASGRAATNGPSSPPASGLSPTRAAIQTARLHARRMSERIPRAPTVAEHGFGTAESNGRPAYYLGGTSTRGLVSSHEYERFLLLCCYEVHCP